MSTDTLTWLTVHRLSPWCWQMFFNFHFVVCGVVWLHHEYEYHPIWLILLQIWKDNFLKMVATRYLLSPTACVNLHWPILHTGLLAWLYIINNDSLKPVAPTSMTSSVFWSTSAPCYKVTFSRYLTIKLILNLVSALSIFYYLQLIPPPYSNSQLTAKTKSWSDNA